jgi:Extensin-like protein C-terminus
MKRGVRWYLVGPLMLAALSGCARMWFAEREPWRGEAEAACLQSGAVREGPAVTIIKSIEGPGVCGADYPLRISALGEPAVPGFADEAPRPPGAVQGAPLASPTYSSYPAPYSPPAASSSRSAGAPISLAPPAVAQTTLDRGYVPDSRLLTSPVRAPVEAVPIGRAATAVLAAAPATLTPTATLACPVVSMLDRFISEHVQPAAARWFGQPVVEIKQISAYSCRGMNGDPHANISEHAFGNALDIAAFTLADGHRITVKDGWHGAPEEQGFLHDVQGAACEMFTTVLAPGSNEYHYDHIHVDLMRRASGRIICQPAAIPGEAAAAGAGGGRYGWRPGAPSLTGSIASAPRPAYRSLPDQAYSDDHAAGGPTR